MSISAGPFSHRHSNKLLSPLIGGTAQTSSHSLDKHLLHKILRILSDLYDGVVSLCPQHARKQTCMPLFSNILSETFVLYGLRLKDPYIVNL